MDVLFELVNDGIASWHIVELRKVGARTKGHAVEIEIASIKGLVTSETVHNVTFRIVLW